MWCEAYHSIDPVVFVCRFLQFLVYFMHKNEFQPNLDSVPNWKILLLDLMTCRKLTNTTQIEIVHNKTSNYGTVPARTLRIHCRGRGLEVTACQFHQGRIPNGYTLYITSHVSDVRVLGTFDVQCTRSFKSVRFVKFMADSLSILSCENRFRFIFFQNCSMLLVLNLRHKQHGDLYLFYFTSLLNYVLQIMFSAINSIAFCLASLVRRQV